MKSWGTLTCLAGVVLALPLGTASAAEAEATHPVMGEYVGFFMAEGSPAVPAEAKVAAQGGGRYRAFAAAQSNPPRKVEIEYTSMDGKTALTEGANRDAWKGTIARGQLTAMSKDGEFLLVRRERRSPTEGLAPLPGAVVLLPFREGEKTSPEAWTNKSWTLAPDGSMQVGKGPNLTRAVHGSGFFHIEFKIPLEPEKSGQARGNSGVYFASRYEIQILDSFGLTPGLGDCGSIYGVAVTRENACLPPLQWQTYDVIYRAPCKTADGGLEPARMTVLHNGVRIHDNQVVPAPTTAAPEKENAERGPLYLQDHGNPVAYRNIWYIPFREPEMNPETEK
jgi:hypothetical protein